MYTQTSALGQFNDRGVRELLSIDANALRALHGVFNFDFEQPFTVLRIKGRYTMNALLKYVPNPADTVTAVLTRDTNARYGHDDLRLARLYADGTFDIGLRIPYLGNRQRCRVDEAYTKGTIHEIRRSDGAETFLIWQHRAFLAQPRETVYTWERLRKVGAYELSRGYDKSGYNAAARRSQLKAGAKSLRMQREKKAFLDTDYSEKLEYLKLGLSVKKAAIIEALKNAHSAEEFSSVCAMLKDYGSGYAAAVRNYERFEQNVRERSYLSVAQAERAYEAIYQAIA